MGFLTRIAFRLFAYVLFAGMVVGGVGGYVYGKSAGDPGATFFGIVIAGVGVFFFGTLFVTSRRFKTHGFGY